ncbi:hypothetical protein G4D61_05525 [Bacillus ginsengihumi]|uniref:Polysaccharide chain length determinant N-terminal domain-containing protein n=1 Tax=Heyndrickxia ginsengihumi TaxID=363870 RepID=A0A6M0P813_9BACI|nr:hypothetical protein [Heyndrickxia ginsengihumi]NEY19428.1 hypothetical protein [Heyndrickxia ginsengihumi]
MDVIRRMAERIKKYIVIVIAIPVLLGIIGWLLPVGKEISAYTAESMISLGDYGNADMNEPSQVITLLSNPAFYEKYTPTLWEKYQEELLKNFHVALEKDKIVQLSMTGTSQADTVKAVNDITNAFLKLDDHYYKQKESIILNSIQTLKDEKVSDDTKVSQQKFIYKLETEKLAIKPATLLQSANDEANTSAGNTTFSSKDRAVLGVLLGITVVFFALVFPEFVRRS